MDPNKSILREFGLFYEWSFKLTFLWVPLMYDKWDNFFHAYFIIDVLSRIFDFFSSNLYPSLQNQILFASLEICFLLFVVLSLLPSLSFHFCIFFFFFFTELLIIWLFLNERPGHLLFEELWTMIFFFFAYLNVFLGAKKYCSFYLNYFWKETLKEKKNHKS